MKNLFLVAGVAALAIAAPATGQGQGKGKGGEKRAQASKVERGGGGKARAQQANRQQSRASDRQRARSNGRNARAERQSQARAQQARGQANRDARAERQRQARNQRQAQQAREARAEQRRGRAQAARQSANQNRREQQRLADRLRDRQQDLRRTQQRVTQLRDRDYRDQYRYRGQDRPFASRGIPASFVDGCPPGLAKQNELCMPPGQYRKLVGQRLPTAYRAQALPSRLRDYYRDTDDYYWRYGDGFAYRVDRDDQLIRNVLPLIGAGLGIGMPFPYSSPDYYVPARYQSFYPDSPYSYHRYANGYVYEIDRNTGLIEDMVPLLDQGYGVGQMLPSSYSYYNLPDPYRSWYRDDDDYYYRYAPGAIYQVDQETQLITSVVSLLTGTNNGLAVGQPLPMGYDMYNVPLSYRDQYYDTPDSWYRYSNGHIYQVDPTTRLITAIVDAIV